MDKRENQTGLTIKELVLHYIDRYRLPVGSTNAEMSDYDKRDFEAIYKKMTRIIKDTFIGGVCLWDLIAPEDKGQARRISIIDFEKQCFPQWRDYLRERYYCNIHGIVFRCV